MKRLEVELEEKSSGSGLMGALMVVPEEALVYIESLSTQELTFSV